MSDYSDSDDYSDDLKRASATKNTQAAGSDKKKAMDAYDYFLQKKKEEQGIEDDDDDDSEISITEEEEEAKEQQANRFSSGMQQNVAKRAPQEDTPTESQDNYSDMEDDHQIDIDDAPKDEDFELSTTMNKQKHVPVVEKTMSSAKKKPMAPASYTNN